ncbi:hypothetical protein [Pedobacter sp.]|uniref:hypothetical protein n=1 Tax=Pedobacter sp. TaxID=1411316 RepID=UPI003D7F5A1B
MNKNEIIDCGYRNDAIYMIIGGKDVIHIVDKDFVSILEKTDEEYYPVLLDFLMAK